MEDATPPDHDPTSAECAAHESVGITDLVNPSRHNQQHAPLPDPPHPQRVGPFRNEGPPGGSNKAPGYTAAGELPTLSPRQTSGLPKAGLPVFNDVPTERARFRRGLQALAGALYPDTWQRTDPVGLRVSNYEDATGSDSEGKPHAKGKHCVRFCFNPGSTKRFPPWRARQQLVP